MVIKNSKEVNDKHKKILETMLKDDANKYCADCNQKGPLWASTNLGVFVCISCAGIHRQLGTHISKVRSVTLDEWTKDQIEHFQQLGNGIANGIYESDMGKTTKINSNCDDRLRISYIKDKYQNKCFCGEKEMPQTKKISTKKLVKKVKSEESSPNVVLTPFPKEKTEIIKSLIDFDDELDELEKKKEEKKKKEILSVEENKDIKKNQNEDKKTIKKKRRKERSCKKRSFKN